MVTGGETAPTIAMPLSLRLPRISVVRNELVVEGKSKRRGEENNMDMEVGTHDEGAARRYYKYLSMEGMSFPHVNGGSSGAAFHPTFHCDSGPTVALLPDTVTDPRADWDRPWSQYFHPWLESCCTV